MFSLAVNPFILPYLECVVYVVGRADPFPGNHMLCLRHSARHSSLHVDTDSHSCGTLVLIYGKEWSGGYVCGFLVLTYGKEWSGGVCVWVLSLDIWEGMVGWLCVWDFSLDIWEGMVGWLCVWVLSLDIREGMVGWCVCGFLILTYGKEWSGGVCVGS